MRRSKCSGRPWALILRTIDDASNQLERGLTADVANVDFLAVPQCPLLSCRLPRRSGALLHSATYETAKGGRELLGVRVARGLLRVAAFRVSSAVYRSLDAVHRASRYSNVGGDVPKRLGFLRAFLHV